MSNSKKYIDIDVKSGLNKITSTYLPYSWDLNIYRGCNNGCKYCFAQYSHSYLDNDDFFDSIYIKKNIVEVVDRELYANKSKGQVINVGGVTDSYQLKESELKFMPQLLKLFIKYKTPIIISTKSALILRDYNLIDELSRLTYVNIACTITTTDEDISRLIEPNASSSRKRFEVLKEFSKTNANTGLHMMPIIPYITDSRHNIESLYKSGKNANVTYALPGPLNLKGKTKPYFLNFIKYSFPSKYDSLVKLYETGYAPIEYKKKLYSMIGEISSKYNLTSENNRTISNKDEKIEKPKQISIWDS